MTVRLYEASVKSEERVERAEIVRSRLVEFRNHSRVERRPLVVSYFREGAVAVALGRRKRIGDIRIIKSILRTRSTM